MELRKFIATTIREYLNEQQILKENIQLADKVYFKTGKLSNEDREIILNINPLNSEGIFAISWALNSATIS